jgi:ABC-type amino acid transport substrate-binding protein
LADAFDATAADRIDLLCGAITITLGRLETVDFGSSSPGRSCLLPG